MLDPSSLFSLAPQRRFFLLSLAGEVLEVSQDLFAGLPSAL
jgi:hypothetical protein